MISGRRRSGIYDLLSGLVVVPDRCGQREDTLRDADSDALEGSAAVLFQVELVLEGVVHRLGQLSHRLQRGLAFTTFLRLERRPQQICPAQGQIRLELLGGEALVCDQQQARAGR